MKTVIEKRIECVPSFSGRETLSDHASDFRYIVTKIYFLGILIYREIKSLSKLDVNP